MRSVEGQGGSSEVLHPAQTYRPHARDLHPPPTQIAIQQWPHSGSACIQWATGCSGCGALSMSSPEALYPVGRRNRHVWGMGYLIPEQRRTLHHNCGTSQGWYRRVDLGHRKGTCMEANQSSIFNARVLGCPPLTPGGDDPQRTDPRLTMRAGKGHSIREL